MKNVNIIKYLLIQPDLRTFKLNPVLLKSPVGTWNPISIPGILSLTFQKFPRRNNCDLQESPLRYRYKDSTKV